MKGPVRLIIRATLLAAIAALPVAFSLWIDFARLRADDDERAIAAALLAGHNVTDIANYDERAIERHLARARKRCDVLALGSSRIQTLPPSAFPGRTFVGAGLSGGRLDDILASYALYDTATRRPQSIVINLDPWTLNTPDGDATWGSLVDERAAMLSRIGAPSSRWRDWIATRINMLKRVAAPESFRLSVFSVRRYGSGGIRVVVTDSAQNAEKTRTPSGMVVWTRTSPERANELAQQYASALRPGTLSWHVDEKQAALLERLVTYAKRSGVHVTLVVLPFNPIAYGQIVRTTGTRLADVERTYRDIAARTSVEVIGTFDPAIAGFTSTDFFDESHIRPHALVRLFAPR